DLARTVEADLVIANDPDADRCSAAVVDPHLGQWRMLSGDELGVLLGDHLIRRHGYSGVMARSVVSSRWLGHVADAAGLESATTLTGFKWIARAAGIAYGYEEAIGYCVLPEVVRDKDGLSAALMVAEMAAEAKAAATTLVGRLGELARRLAAVGPGGGSGADRRDDAASAPGPADRAARFPGDLHAGPLAGLGGRRRPAARGWRRPALGRRHPRRGPPLGHGAEAQVLPG